MRRGREKVWGADEAEIVLGRDSLKQMRTGGGTGGMRRWSMEVARVRGGARSHASGTSEGLQIPFPLLIVESMNQSESKRHSVIFQQPKPYTPLALP